ncbi:MAG: histidine--tRNA ligase [Verrucomicrobia bacterium]|jgi:histidyl-tRNA synthetase|nr:histidine--tRNA ligase [Verrucomicrobiota bacterium]
MKQIGRLPGFRDFFPDPVPHPDLGKMSERQHIFNTWRQVARRYGFREYDGPPLETLDLYKAKSGDEIVHQLYHFTDKGDRDVAMRPEMTPTLARMVAAHQRNYKKPMKWFSVPQLFRYERQQKGRLREHFQLNADIIGDANKATDAELIALVIDVLRALGMNHEDFVIRLSSRDAWQAFFEERCTDPDKAYEFYQAVDKLERETPEVSAEKFGKMGISYEEVTAFIQAGKPTEDLEIILEQLEARGLGNYIKIDYGVIRGLAYYTGVVFEAFDRKGEYRAIAGGGRYDHLIKLISGNKVDLPSLGFGMGDVVLADMLREKGLFPKPEPVVDVYFQILNEDLRKESITHIQALRDKGIAVEWPMTPSGANKQFKSAVELGARFVVSLAEQGLLEVKDLKSRETQQLSIEAFAEKI